MKLLTIIALCLAGCATPIEGLYQQQAACLGTEGDCDSIAEEIERREQQIAAREYQALRRCPRGYVEFCDQTMKGCGAMRKKPTDEFYCVSRRSIMR